MVTAPPKPDDLKKVEGIGPKINAALNAAGIRTYIQLASAPVAVASLTVTVSTPAASSAWPSTM